MEVKKKLESDFFFVFKMAVALHTHTRTRTKVASRRSVDKLPGAIVFGLIVVGFREGMYSGGELSMNLLEETTLN